MHYQWYAALNAVPDDAVAQFALVLVEKISGPQLPSEVRDIPWCSSLTIEVPKRHSPTVLSE